MILEVRYVEVLASDYYQKPDENGFLVPSKALLIPDAADSIVEAVSYFKEQYGVDILFSDMFRAATEQNAIKKKRGKWAAFPGFSGHNFGQSVDIHTNRVFAQFRKAKIGYTLKRLREDLAKFGWTHIDSEQWHFNFLKGRPATRVALSQDYGRLWESELSVTTVQQYLADLGYYNMKVDGIKGRGTKRAIKDFQKDFSLSQDGIVGPMTRRVLVAASMTVQLV